MSDVWHLHLPAEGDRRLMLMDPRGLSTPFDSADARRAIGEVLTPAARLVVESPDWVDALALGGLSWHVIECAGPWAVAVTDERPMPEPVPEVEFEDELELEREVEPVPGSKPAPESEPAPEPVSESEPATEATVPSTAKPPKAPPAPSSVFRALVAAVLQAATRYGKAAPATLKAVDEARAFPGFTDVDLGRLTHTVTQGDRQFRALAGLDALLSRTPPEEPAAVEYITEMRARFSRNFYILTRIDRAVQRAEARFARARQSDVGSRVRAGDVPHQLPLLAPRTSWTLLIDEGGEFSAVESGQVIAGGKVVGLLIPEGTQLAPLTAGWHAIEQTDLGEIDRVVQAVLDAPVGVLGLRTESLVGTLGDTWLTAVLELVGWVIRLVPLDGPTRLEVLVEQRGDHVHGTRWQAGAVALRRFLAEVDPERAAQVDLSLRLIGKADSPWNGYVDALAFTWTSPTRPSQARLKQSGLRGRCLLNHGGAEATLLREAILAPDALPPILWSRLIALPDAVESGSLVSLLLSRAARACRLSPEVWRRYLDAAQSHLEGKSIRLSLLGRQIDFLAGCAPDGTVLTPMQQFAWTVAKLEAANHHGAVDDASAQALESLGNRLFDERPSLVCQADLDVAVMHTNAFRFESASQALSRWRDQPMAVPGRQHWGRMRSSLGQHAAFRGDTNAALSHFRAALEAFDGLSDPALAAAERQHTQTYVALAAMDAPSTLAINARAEVEQICSLEPGAIRSLAASTQPAERYAHHMLVRWLWQHGTAAERSEYLVAAEQSGLKGGDGHPWPLIQAYRAALLVSAGRPAPARMLLETAIDDARDGGPTLRFIAVALAQFRARLFGERPLDVRDASRSLREALPAAPWAVLDDAARRDPADFLKAVLPFNFR